MIKTYLILLLSITGIFTISQAQTISPPSVQKPVYFDISPPLREMAHLQQPVFDASWKDGIVINHFNDRHHGSQPMASPGFRDLSVQSKFGMTTTDTTLQDFEGLGGGNLIPPDTYGDVGPNHYFQVVNCAYAIYNKTGTILLGPMPSSTVWQGMPNNANSGDAVVVYDENADRWLFSQFSLPNYPNGPFYQMIAISQTPDPTGSWYRYQYIFADMPDYPKFGVWPDGYYMSCNRFGAGGYLGTGAAAFNRNLMLVGDPSAQMILFTLPNTNEAYSMLPADCDGDFPTLGTPNYFTYEYDASPYHLGILEFHADWENTASATLGNFLSVPVNAFNSNLGNGIPQKGTSVTLATLSDRLMYRLQFRKFNDHWSMVCNHSVNAGGNVAGVRWYELRKTTGAWNIYQQATYAPTDNICRWMGSMAMDTAGDIALGYSVSSSNLYPSIRYTGRLKSDPLNTMTINERGIINGGGCQTSFTNRWGDYSSMTVDPASPTTFWFTSEYYAVTSASNWQTRVASFTFSNVYSTYATASPEKICVGDSSQLTSVAYGGSGNYTYSWTSVPAGFTSNIKSPKVSPTDSTTYIVTVSDGNIIHHDTTRVLTLFPPVVFAGNDTTVCKTASSIGISGSASNYNWFSWATSGNGTFSNPKSLTTTYHFGSHDYAVDSVDLYLLAFANSPCQGRVMSTKRVMLSPCNGIENIQNVQSLILEPNPAKESVTVIVNGFGNKQALLTLTDLQGDVLYSEVLEASGNQVTKQLDLSMLTAGIYFVKVKIDANILIKRLIREGN